MVLLSLYTRTFQEVSINSLLVVKGQNHRTWKVLVWILWPPSILHGKPLASSTSHRGLVLASLHAAERRDAARQQKLLLEAMDAEQCGDLEKRKTGGHGPIYPNLEVCVSGCLTYSPHRAC